MTQTNIGRELAAKRKQVTKPCEWCGKPITGTTRRKYCDNKCKQAKKYEKKKQIAAEKTNKNNVK